jgi:hypothetical protein
MAAKIRHDGPLRAKPKVLYVTNLGMNFEFKCVLTVTSSNLYVYSFIVAYI